MTTDMQRTASIRRWLAITTGRRASDAQHTLALKSSGQDAPVATWPKDDVTSTRTEELAAEIAAYAQDAADDAPGGSARLLLQWLDASGAVLTAYTWRAGDVQAFDGSDEMRSAQNQRHLEAMTKHTIAAGVEASTALQIALSEYKDIVKTLREENAYLRAQLLTRDEELDNARAKAGAPQETSAVDEVVKTLGTGVVEVVKNKLTAGIAEAMTSEGGSDGK